MSLNPYSLFPAPFSDYSLPSPPPPRPLLTTEAVFERKKDKNNRSCKFNNRSFSYSQSVVYTRWSLILCGYFLLFIMSGSLHKLGFQIGNTSEFSQAFLDRWSKLLPHSQPPKKKKSLLQGTDQRKIIFYHNVSMQHFFSSSTVLSVIISVLDSREKERLQDFPQ